MEVDNVCVKCKDDLSTKEWLALINSPIITSFAGYEMGDTQIEVLKNFHDFYHPLDLEVRFRRPIEEINATIDSLGLKRVDTSDQPIRLLTKHLLLQEIKYLTKKVKSNAKKFSSRSKKPLIRTS